MAEQKPLYRSGPLVKELSSGDTIPATALPSHTHALSSLTQSGATTGQVPTWNGSTWVADDGTPGPDGPTGPAGADGGFDSIQDINAQTGTTYTLVLADLGKLVTLSNASAITLTVPPNADVAFSVGSHVDIAQIGAGQVTIAPGSGVTIGSRNGTKLAGQYAIGTLIKIDTNTWLSVGDITT